METIRARILLIIIFACFFLNLGTATAGAEVTYAGELCLVLSYPALDPEPTIVSEPIKLGMLEYGDGHYSLNGTVITAGGNYPVYGTGFVQNTTAVISLISSLPSRIQAIDINLDLNTWNTGTCSIMQLFPAPADAISCSSVIGGICQ